jgi:hypothetical protein
MSIKKNQDLNAGLPKFCLKLKERQILKNLPAGGQTSNCFNSV